MILPTLLLHSTLSTLSHFLLISLDSLNAVAALLLCTGAAFAILGTLLFCCLLRDTHNQLRQLRRDAPPPGVRLC